MPEASESQCAVLSALVPHSQSNCDEEGPQQIAIPLNPLPGIVDEAVALDEIARVTIRDVRVVDLR